MNYISDIALEEMPKKPPTSFMKFRLHHLEDIKAKYPEKGILDQSRLLGEMWRNLSEKERLQYKSNAEEEMTIYSQQYDQWLKKFGLKDKTVQMNMKVIRRKERQIREKAAKLNKANNPTEERKEALPNKEPESQKETLPPQPQHPSKQVLKEFKELQKINEISKKEEEPIVPIPVYRYARKTAPLKLDYGTDTSDISNP